MNYGRCEFYPDPEDWVKAGPSGRFGLTAADFALIRADVEGRESQPIPQPRPKPPEEKPEQRASSFDEDALVDHLVSLVPGQQGSKASPVKTKRSFHERRQAAEDPGDDAVVSELLSLAGNERENPQKEALRPDPDEDEEPEEISDDDEAVVDSLFRMTRGSLRGL